MQRGLESHPKVAVKLSSDVTNMHQGQGLAP